MVYKWCLARCGKGMLWSSTKDTAGFDVTINANTNGTCPSMYLAVLFDIHEDYGSQALSAVKEKFCMNQCTMLP